ncbi:MAG: RNA polymerase sigma factor [Pseudomonadota bacterium]
MAGRQVDIALDTFVTRRNDLVALANRVVKNRAIAEELVQDSWIQWSSKTYPNGDASPIFSRIVLNLSFDWLRKQKREWTKLEAFSLLYDSSPDTERVVIARHDLLNVMRALQQLTPRSLRAFRLSRVEEMTFAEIGQEMGLATSTAHRLVSEALIKVALVTQK